MKSIVKFCIITILLAIPTSSQEEEEELQEGQIYFMGLLLEVKYIMWLSNCSNLPDEIAGYTWIVNVNNNKCVQIYDQPSCKGESIRLTPRSPHQDTLYHWEFGEKAYSVGFCQESCTPEFGQTISSDPISPSSIEVTLYEEPNYGGKAYPIQIDGCTTISNQNDSRVKLNTRLQSLRIPKGACLLAFMNNSTRDDQINISNSNDCLVKDSYNVVELYDGAPALDNLTVWYLNEMEYVSAIAPCQCDYVRFPGDIPAADGLYIILFTELDFEGKSIILPLNFTGCKDFVTATDYNLIEWLSVTQSIVVGNGSCVQLYEEQDCEDLSPVKLTSSVGDLADYNLRWAVRSISICDVEVPVDAEESTPSSDNPPYNGGSSLSKYLIPIVSVGILVSVALGGALFYMRRRTLRLQNASENFLTEKEVTDFLDGLKLEANVTDGEDATETGDTQSITFSCEMIAQTQPYRQELEISRDQLEFDIKRSIGEGQYGVVYQGTLNRDEQVVKVAIKAKKPLSGAKGLRSLLKEVKVMMYVGNHSKIVTLFGCCTVNLREGELLIIMEYCDNGSLEKYLKANKANFVDLFRNVNPNEQEQESEQPSQYVQCCESAGDYIDNIPAFDTPISTEPESNPFNIHQLITWCIEIAEGMEFLASKKIIHGDLSARNILLSENKSAKISDFGLATKLYAYQQYIRTGDEALPWRWLALESLKKMEFSTASDVWSYGILAWEIFSLGEQPYPGIPFWTNNFIKTLEQGLRPTFPPIATSECYEIMLSCWNDNAQDRPLFSQLQASFIEAEETVKRNIKTAEYEIIHYV